MKDKKKSENQTYYMPIGMSIGLCIGSLMDAQNHNKVKDAPKDEETE